MTALVPSLLSSIVSALLLFLLCQSIGWAWTQSAAAGWEGRPRSAACIRLMAGFGVGLWIVSILVMVWGMTVGLSLEKNLILWLALIAGGWRSWGPLFAAYGETCRGLRLSRSEKAAAALLSVLVVWGLAFALVPPLFTDTVRYHLGVPHSWWRDGAIEKLPQFSEQHLVMMWQHASLLLLGFDQAAGAKVFCFLPFPMTLLAVGIWVNRRCGFAAAFFSTLMLGATPAFFGNSVLGAVDAGLAFFSAMALLYYFGGDTTHDLRPATYRWVGVMAGLAFCTKWQGLALLPGLAAAEFFRRERSLLRPIAGMAAVCFLMFLPWGLRNFFWSGDPVYPFLARFFSPETGAVAARFDGLLSHYGLSGEPWWQYLLYPLHLTFADCKFWFGGRIGFESRIGWMYLFMLPFCLAALKRDAGLRPLLLFGLVCFVLGLLQGQLPRFLMPAWVAFAAASGWALHGSSRPVRRLLLAVLGLFSLWNLGAVTKALNQAAFAPLAYYRLGSADVLYARVQPEWRAARWTAAHCPGSPVLLAGLDGNLFWNNPVTVDGPFDEKTLVQIARSSAGPEEIAARLKARGIGLIAIDSGRAELLDGQFGYMGWEPETRDKIRKFFRDDVTRVYRDGGIQVGRIR